MLADALVQYLVAKRWRNILLVPGQSEADRAYAEAMTRSIKKFGAKLVASKVWDYDPGARRTDTGHVAIGAEVARFTQGLSYDVLVVLDEEDEFGSDLPYRTTDPRPVAGTQGLVPSAWARAFSSSFCALRTSPFVSAARPRRSYCSALDSSRAMVVVWFSRTRTSCSPLSVVRVCRTICTHRAGMPTESRS